MFILDCYSDRMVSFQVFIFLLVIFIFSIDTKKVCPSYGYMGFEDGKFCFDQCSPDNDQCESNTKCCFFLTHPCGHRCIVPKDNISKFGECPSPNSNQIDILWNMCDIRLCDVDNDCQDDQKCCLNKCNTRMCVTPTQSRMKRALLHR
jgi:hypothetical protein